MQVNSNLTFNSYDGSSAGLSSASANTPTTKSTASLSDKPVVQPEQYQAQLEQKKALESVGQNTIINIGTPGPLSATTTNSNNPVASDKFLESFSKMLDGFLASVTKMLDSFMTKLTEMLGKANSSAQTPTSTSTNTPGSSSSTTPIVRDLKTWETKASEYMKADEKGMVSESDVQEAVVKYQLYQKSDQAEKVIIQELDKAKASTQNRQSALKTALKNTVASGAITQAEADYVYSISFKASQFDSEVDKISTAKSTGGLSANNAIQLGAVNLTMIRAGNMKLDSMSVDSLN